MIFRFTFTYDSCDIDYFLSIISRVANSICLQCFCEKVDNVVDSKIINLPKDILQHQNFQNNNIIFVYIQGELQDLQTFSSDISNEIPLSIYFVLRDVSVVESIGINAKIYTPKTGFIPSLKEINNIIDPNSEYFCDIFRDCDFKVYGNGNELDTKYLLKNHLLKLSTLIKEHHSVIIDTPKGIFEVSLSFNENIIVMMCDLSNVMLYTRISTDEANILASFEKPIISLMPKEVFANEFNNSAIDVVLPFDVIFMAFCRILLNCGVPYIFLTRVNNINKNSAHLSYINGEYSNFQKLTVGNGGIFITNEKLECDSYDSFIKKSFVTTNDTMECFLSLQNPSRFNCGVAMFDTSFDMNPKNILNKISLSPSGSKLLKNYAMEYPHLWDMVNSFGDEKFYSDNILNILGVIALIIGASKDINKCAILKYANLFLRDVGPRIDFKLKNIGSDDLNNNSNVIAYDCIPTIQSSISFLLAGMERETLCFGVLDSFADFCINCFRDAYLNYNISSVNIAGDLFAIPIFFKRITKKLTNDIKLTFPKYIDFC